MSRNTASNTGPWSELTWDELESWGALSKGESYQRSGRVQDLARSADGLSLVAWVDGSERYATRADLVVTRGKRTLSSDCSCPLGVSGCKHGVAVVLEYLDRLKNKTDVPVATKKDRRWKLAEEGGDLDDDDWSDGDEDEDEDEPEERPVRRGGRSSRSPKTSQKQLREYLEGMPAADLVAYVMQLTEQNPHIASELTDRRAVARSDASELIRKARKEIKRLTAEEAWSNDWSGEGNLPDYSGLKGRLEQLLEMGQADALLELGEELFERGQEQVESSQDDGDTAEAIGNCLDVVWKAVPLSTRSDRDKLLYAIDMSLGDDYSFCENLDAVFERDWPTAAWSEVADELVRRVSRLPSRSDDFHTQYQRRNLTGWLTDALEYAGRDTEVLALCETEARTNGDYGRLVSLLIERGRLDDAWQVALEGIEKLEEKQPGTGNHLRDSIRDLAARKRDWLTVAAMRAEEFFAQPGLHTLAELEKAAKKAHCEERVRAGALAFLETGKRPAAATTTPSSAGVRTGRKKSGAAGAVPTDAAWPLPVLPPALRRKGFREGPHLNVLLQLAIAEKRPDDVLRWYDALKQSRKQNRYAFGCDHEAMQVADAIAATHPDKALAIYQQHVVELIGQTSPSSYQAAVPTLKKIQKMLKDSGKASQWKTYLANLRETHARKRRLMEVLDRLENPRIL